MSSASLGQQSSTDSMPSADAENSVAARQARMSMFGGGSAYVGGGDDYSSSSSSSDSDYGDEEPFPDDDYDEASSSSSSSSSAASSEFGTAGNLPDMTGGSNGSGGLRPSTSIQSEPFRKHTRPMAISVLRESSPTSPTSIPEMGAHVNPLLNSYQHSDSEYSLSPSPLSPNASRSLPPRMLRAGSLGHTWGGRRQLPLTPPPRHGRSKSLFVTSSRPFTPPPPGRLVRKQTIDSVGHLAREHGTRKVMSANDTYIVRKSLGQGAFGKVKLVQSVKEPDKFYAMKVQDKKQLMKQRKCGIRLRHSPSFSTELTQVQREIAIMKKLKHPNVVQCYEVIHDDKRDKLFFVMDYAKKGPVFKGRPETWKPYEEETVWRYTRDLIAGLEYLHFQEHIIHRDMKPENLLITADDRLKICDFGESQEFKEDDIIDKTAGTPEFMAPEMCRGDTGFSGREADVWSSGVCVYTMIYAKLPFTAPNRIAIYDVIGSADEVALPEEPVVNPDLQDLLLGMMRKDPTKRLTLAQVKQHKWITQDGKWPMEEMKSEHIEVTKQDLHAAVVRMVRLKSTFKQKLKRIRHRLSIGLSHNPERQAHFNKLKRLSHMAAHNHTQEEHKAVEEEVNKLKWGMPSTPPASMDDLAATTVGSGSSAGSLPSKVSSLQSVATGN